MPRLRNSVRANVTTFVSRDLRVDVTSSFAL